MSFWTEEKLELLKELIDKKLVAREIGIELGCSKSAVIAKCARIGLKLGDHNSRGKTPMPEVLKVETSPVKIKNITGIKNILDLKDHHCRYPFNDVGSPDFFFCGADVKEGKSYCVKHCMTVYKPYEKRSFKEPNSKSFFSFKRSK